MLCRQAPLLKHYSAMNERDASILYEGASTADILAIEFAPATVYRDVTITVTSPSLNDSPLLSVCTMEVLQFCSGCHEQCGVEDAVHEYDHSFSTQRVSKTDVFAESE